MFGVVGWVVLAVALTLASFEITSIGSFLLLLGAFLSGFLLVVGYQAAGMAQQVQVKADRSSPPSLVTASDKISWHHRDEPVKYKLDKRLTGATCIDTVLQDCLGFLCRDYVEWFYYSVGNHPVFVHEVQRSLQQIVINFANRAKMVDWTPFFTKRIPDDFASHLRLFRLTEERLWKDKGRERLSPSPTPSREEGRQESTHTFAESTGGSDLTELEQAFFAVEERMDHCLRYRDVLCSVEAEKQYLRDLSEFLLFLLLPQGDFESRILRQLLKEVIVSSVILPTVETLCDVDYVNQTIVWLCKPSTFNADFFLHCVNNSTSVEELEEILRQIGIESDRLRQQDSNEDPEEEAKHQLESLVQLRHTCAHRLEQLKQGNVDLEEGQDALMPSDSRHGSLRLPSAVIASLPLMVVLNNHLALSHFYNFLELRPEKKTTNFWVNVEAFRTSAQQVLLVKAEAVESGSSSSPDVEYVREMAMNIFEEYLSETSRLSCIDSSLCQQIWRKISTGRPSGDWFDHAQNAAFVTLEQGCYREFQRSDHYSQCLAELEMAGRQEEGGIAVNVEEVDDDDDGEASVNSEHSSSADILTASGTYPEPVDVSAPSPSDEVAELVLSVPAFEDVRQGNKTIIYYTVQVFCRYVHQANGVTWHVLRRFSDFVDFQLQLKERYDISLPLPSKHTFGNFDKKLLEKRRVGLEAYVKELVAAPLVQQHPGILQMVVGFAHPGMYSKEKRELARRMTNLVAPVSKRLRDVRGGFNDRMKSSPGVARRGTTLSTDRPAEEAARPEEDMRMSSTLGTEDEDNIPLRILLLLMDEVFELSTKNKWLRRHVTVILRSLVRRTFGDFINRKIIEQVEWITSAEQIGEFVKLFRDAMWPNGIIGPYADKRDEATKIRTQSAARTMMLGSVPDDLRLFIGATATESGMVRMFNMFQSKRLNKRLLYLLLEALIETLFKDNNFSEIFKKLHPTAQDGRRRTGTKTDNRN